MYIYVYIYTYIYTRVYAYIHVYPYSYTQIDCPFWVQTGILWTRDKAIREQK